MKASKITLSALLLTAAFSAAAAPSHTATGKLVAAGGVDDTGIRIELDPAQAKRLKRQVCSDVTSGECAFEIEGGKASLWLWCGKDCVNLKWLQPSTEHDGYDLKPRYAGKKVRVSFAEEINHGDRIAGPGADAKLLFVNKIRYLR